MFLFSLAESLGMTVNTLCKEMSQDELAHWIAYSKMKCQDSNKSAGKAMADDKHAFDDFFAQVDTLRREQRKKRKSKEKV